MASFSAVEGGFSLSLSLLFRSTIRSFKFFSSSEVTSFGSFSNRALSSSSAFFSFSAASFCSAVCSPPSPAPAASPPSDAAGVSSAPLPRREGTGLKEVRTDSPEVTTSSSHSPNECSASATRDPSIRKMARRTFTARITPTHIKLQRRGPKFSLTAESGIRGVSRGFPPVFAASRKGFWLRLVSAGPGERNTDSRPWDHRFSSPPGQAVGARILEENPEDRGSYGRALYGALGQAQTIAPKFRNEI